MALDPSIILQGRGIQLDSPIDTQNKLAQLYQARSQNRLADLTFADNQRERAGENSLSQLLAAGKSGDDVVRGLAEQGYGKSGLAYGKQFVERQKATADIGKVGADTDHVKAQTAETQAKAINLASQQHRDALNTINDPQQAAAWVSSLHSDPRLAPIVAYGGTLEEALARIPTDPVKFQQWKMQSQLGAEQLIKQTTPDANARLTANTSIDNSKRSAASSKYAADISARTAGARLAFDKEKEAGIEDSALGPMATRLIAQQYLAGDNAALGNIGRGTQGAKNLSMVRNEVARQANVAGMNGADIAAKMAEFGGMKAGQRTLGTRTANIEIAAAEAAELAPLALAASLKVPRSGLLPFGKLQVMFDANTNDPDIREFAMANTALVNAFGQVMSRGGVATVADKAHAAELLATAFDQPSYARAVAQLQKEIQAAQRAPGKVRKEMSAATSGRASDHGTPPAAPAASAVPSDIDALLKKHGGK